MSWVNDKKSSETILHSMLKDNKYHSVGTKDKKESYKYSQRGDGRRVVGRGKCGRRLEEGKQ